MYMMIGLTRSVRNTHKFTKSAVRTCLFTLACFSYFTTVLPLWSAERWKPEQVVCSSKLGPHGMPLFSGVFIDHKECLFLVDTGCSRTILDSSLTKGLNARSTNDGVQTRGEAIRISMYDAPAISLGGVECDWIREVGSLDLSVFRKQMNKNLNGILGMDVLSRFSLHLDFDNAVALILVPSDLEKPPGTSTTLSFSQANCPCIVALLDGGLDERFSIDTGLTSTGTVRHETYHWLESKNYITPTGIADSVLAADSSHHDVILGRCRGLAVGEIVHKDLVVSSSDSNTLGMSFLFRHRVTLDFVNRRAFFEPNKYFGLRDRNDYEGVVTDHRLIVRKVVPNSIGDKAGFKTLDQVLRVEGIRDNELTRQTFNRALASPQHTDRKVEIRRLERILTITLPGG
jgi:hypothetical protein